MVSSENATEGTSMTNQNAEVSGGRLGFLLVLPTAAERVEVFLMDDGSVFTGWLERCCDNDSHIDSWSVTFSADRLRVDVVNDVGSADTTCLLADSIWATVRHVLQHLSGVTVNLSIRSETKGIQPPVV